MSKCLYTESEVTQSGAQVLITAMTLNGETDKHSKKFQHAFPGAWEVMGQMRLGDHAEHTDENSENLTVNLGDVIWSHQGGNRQIGFCFVKESEKGDINKKAVALCIKSAVNKAKSLGIGYVGMDLMGCKDGKEWADIVDIVENSLGECKGFVCIPTNEELVDVLENLPGPNSFQIFKSDNE